MKTQSTTKDFLVKAGGVYGWQHPIVKDKDHDFVFRNNAEECYRAMHKIFRTRLYAGAFAASFIIVGICGLVLCGSYLATIVVISNSLAIAFLAIKPKVYLNQIAMARRWKPVRKNLVKLLRSRPLPHKILTGRATVKISLTQIDNPLSQKKEEFKENKSCVEAVISEIAQRIADDKILFQINSHRDNHRRYDREKHLVDKISDGLSWQRTGWAGHFRQAKVRHHLIKG